MLALDQYVDALANGPQPLSWTQRIALVGDIYREAKRELDTDDSFLDAIEAVTGEFEDNVADHLGRVEVGEVDQSEIEVSKPADEKTAELMAAIDMYDPKAMAAWALKHESNPAKRNVALEQLYRPLVAKEIARKQVVVDAQSRSMTLEVMGQVAEALARWRLAASRAWIIPICSARAARLG